jgi:hypothetical protein
MARSPIARAAFAAALLLAAAAPAAAVDIEGTR